MRLPDFSGLRIAVIGDVMLDRYWWGDTTRISPEAPVPVVRLDKLTDAIGGAGNVAANIAGLGAIAILVGVIGDDIEGSILSSLLNDLDNVNSRLVTVSGRPTTVKTRVVSGGRHVVRVDRETTEDAGLSHDLDLRSAINDADLIVLSDYAKGVLSDATLKSIFDLSRDKKVVVDPKSNKLSRYSGASLITPNAKEAIAASGAASAYDAGVQIVSDHDFEAVLVTEGEHGMTLFRRDQSPEKHQAAALEAFDVTGAGDTVISTLCVCLAAGVTLSDAIEIANTAAGIAVSHVGTTIVTREMLEAAL